MMERMEAQMQDRYDAYDDATKADAKSKVVYDKNGREIMVGDVLKVFHFTAALRREKHFMYKQVVAKRGPIKWGYAALEVSHLDLSDDHYLVICDGSVLADHEIIQSIDCKFKARPRVTPTPEQ